MRKRYYNPRTAWRQQAIAASQRGIIFELTFEDWINWWEVNLGSDWFEKRGKKRGQFVMARIEDKGPYKIGNIKCITSEANAREVAIKPKTQSFKNKMSVRFKGILNPSVKLNEYSIIVILNSDLKNSILAKAFNVTPETIKNVRERKTWV